MKRCYTPGTCSVLGIDWAGHTQNGLTHCLSFLLSFTDWLLWSIFLPHPFSSCCSKIYFNIWEVMFAPLFTYYVGKVYLFFSRQISLSFYLIFTKTGTRPFSILSARLGSFREPWSGAGAEDYGCSELEMTSSSTCLRLFWGFTAYICTLPAGVSPTKREPSMRETHGWELLM